MTQEDKELLLQDLCARLPYGVIIQVKDWTDLDAELKIGHINRLQINDVELKPYLFPMSSMTEEEWEDCRKIRMIGWAHGGINGTFINAGLIVDWLNRNHFDYRGLIEKGLAIPVTKENNPYK